MVDYHKGKDKGSDEQESGSISLGRAMQGGDAFKVMLANRKHASPGAVNKKKNKHNKTKAQMKGLQQVSKLVKTNEIKGSPKRTAKEMAT